MTYPFDDSLRREVASRCAAFPRRPAGDAGRGLKPAAVAITLTQAEDGSGEAAFLLTKRTHRLRAHGGQWALPGGRCDAGETATEAALRELEEELAVSVDPAPSWVCWTTIRRARATSSRRSWSWGGADPRCA